jgi:hypothetical protein
VPICCELIVDGRAVTVPDPAGGTFDAAGDFDRLLPMRGPLPAEPSSLLPVLSRVNPDGGVEFNSEDMAAIVEETVSLQGKAKPGPESRGLARLRALAEYGQHLPNAVLRVLGD